SAAAPHAAAIAALLWSYDQHLTPLQMRAALTGGTLDIEGPGLDINAGAGLLMADLPLQSLPPKPILVPGTPVFVAEFCPNGTLDPGEKVSLSISLTNFGAASTTNLVATLLNSGGITFPSGPQNYGTLAAHGGTATRSFTFTGNGTCGATNLVTLQLR